MNENQETKSTAADASHSSPTPGSEPKLYEITALVNYSVVIRANSKEDALKHIETWERAWDSSADLIGVTDVDLIDVRDGTAEDAHEDISQNVESTHGTNDEK